MAVICLLGLAILILGGVLLFQGFTIPGVSFDRVQLIVADIAVMVTAIIVGAIVAVLVMKGGRRRFAP